MKKIAILFSIFSIILITSCTKELEDRLPGTWDFSSSYKYAEMTETITGLITFNEDGTGTLTTDCDGCDGTSSFTWTSNSEGDLIIDGDETYTNEVNKKKEQVFIGIDAVGGNTAETELRLTK